MQLRETMLAHHMSGLEFLPSIAGTGGGVAAKKKRKEVEDI